MLTIGQLARKYALSRSTLIYYDSIGLLPPCNRSSANYRLYSNCDIEKLERIILFRSAGMSLETISELFEKHRDKVNSALEKRLFSINKEIQLLRNQQNIIIKIIENEGLINNSRIITKSKWVSLLEAVGLDENGMKKWHSEFEKTSPEAHQDFLESIGIDYIEISSIRTWSRNQI